MNKVILMGRLTRDPEVRYSQGEKQTAIGRFSLAVDRRIKREGQPEADFFNCTAFGKIGEFVEKYLKKGTKVVVEGSLQNNHYTDKDGVKHYDYVIVAESIEFAESKSSNGGAQNAQNTQTAQGQTTTAPASAPSNDGFMNIPDGIDEELPFN